MLRINTNIASLQAQRTLSNTTRALSRALERLSSGKRITRAGDDAAGLAISERLRSEVGGLSRTAQNVNEAFGLLATADGVLSSQTELLQRMRELSVQAANGTVSTTERQHLDTEFQTLLAEFDRLAESSQFNEVNLLDGSFETKSIQVGTQKDQAINLSLGSTRSVDVLPEGVTSTQTVGTGTFASESLTSLSSRPVGLLSEDFNSDGNADLFYTTGAAGLKGAVIALGNGQGGFTIAQTISMAVMGDGGASSGDFNEDGILDLAIYNRSNADISIYTGDGDGSFTFGMTVTTAGEVGSIAVADINEDGNVDLVSTNGSNRSVSLILGNGSGGFTVNSTVATDVTYSFTCVEAGDFNHDNNLDLAFTRGSSVMVKLGDGTGGFGVGVNYFSGAACNFVRLADFNGDGNLDMASSNSNDYTFRIQLGDGSGSFASAGSYGVGTNPQDFALGDLDGDDDIDILLSSLGSTNLTVLLNDGSGIFSYGTTIVTSDVNKRVILEDFTNDGVLDYIVNDESGSPNGYRLGVGNSTTETLTTAVELDLTTQANAQDVLELLDEGLAQIAAQRSGIGAVENRLQSALSSILLTQENLAAARSQIIDADIAQETAELTRAQILQQAGVSVLGQANTSMQMVLGLLRGL